MKSLLVKDRVKDFASSVWTAISYESASVECWITAAAKTVVCDLYLIFFNLLFTEVLFECWKSL